MTAKEIQNGYYEIKGVLDGKTALAKVENDVLLTVDCICGATQDCYTFFLDQISNP